LYRWEDRHPRLIFVISVLATRGRGKGESEEVPFSSRLASSAASKLGFSRRVSTQKLPFNSHGEPGYTDGKNYITRDNTSHTGGSWKMFNRNGVRLGTYDENLNRIGK
jgi:hypothetical protein